MLGCPPTESLNRVDLRAINFVLSLHYCFVCYFASTAVFTVTGLPNSLLNARLPPSLASPLRPAAQYMSLVFMLKPFVPPVQSLTSIFSPLFLYLVTHGTGCLPLFSLLSRCKLSLTWCSSKSFSLSYLYAKWHGGYYCCYLPPQSKEKTNTV